MKGLDLRQLKKVSSDDKMTVFKHDLGHEIKIAHAKLSPKMLEELKALPTKGQKPQKMADGGTPNPQPNASPDDEDDSQPQAPVVLNVGQNQPAPQPNASPSDWTASAGSAPQDGGQGAMPTPPTPAEEAASPPAQRQIAQAPEPSASAPTQPDATVQSTADVSSLGQPAPTTPQQVYQNNMEHLTTDNAAFANDLQNGHITPETYSDLFAKKSTLGKIGMIFGLMVGGAGAGLAHQQNALLASMNQEINNDLEAQKQSKANAQNWLRLSQQHQANQAGVGLTEAQTGVAKSTADINAVQLASDRMKLTALHSMYQKLGMLPAGPQKATGEQVLGGVTQAVNQDLQQGAHKASTAVAQAHALAGNQNEQDFAQKNQAMRMLGMTEIADNAQKTHVPGFGEASIPVSQSDRDKLTAGLTFQNQLSRFIDWSKAHSGDINPVDERTGKALAAGLQGAYRQATNGGVYKAGEQDFISSIIDSDPTKFFNKIRTLPQLDAVKADSAAQLDQTAKSVGLPGYAGQTQQAGTAAPGVTGEKEQTTTSKSGKPIVPRNGKWVYK